MTDLQESNLQLAAAWRTWALRCPYPRIASDRGVEITYCGLSMAFFNMASPAAPLQSWEELHHIVDVAAFHGRESGVPWMIPLCDEWLPGPPAVARQILEQAGLFAAMPLTGMIADDVSAGPPSPLVFHRADTLEERALLLDINAKAYDMTIEDPAGALSAPRMWEGETGVVGYYEGRPVSAAAVMNVEGRRYVCWVSTLPEWQGRGFAAAATRQALAWAAGAMGPVRTVLHATEAGRPVYEKLGYRAVANYTVYTPAAYRTADPAESRS